MKTTLLLSLSILTLGAAAAHGQLAATGGTTHNLTLDVENKGAGGASTSTGGGLPNPGPNNNNNNNNTATTTSTQTRNHATTLEVSIRSLDKTQDQVIVEWYFFGKKVQNHRAGKESVFDSGTKTVSIAPTGGAVFDITSKVAQTTRTTRTTATNNNNNGNQGNANNRNNNISYTTDEQQSGTEISGWVVRMIVDGRVYDAKGSEFKYEDAAKDPDKFAQLKAGKYNE